MAFKLLLWRMEYLQFYYNLRCVLDNSEITVSTLLVQKTRSIKNVRSKISKAMHNFFKVTNRHGKVEIKLIKTNQYIIHANNDITWNYRYKLIVHVFSSGLGNQSICAGYFQLYLVCVWWACKEDFQWDTMVLPKTMYRCNAYQTRTTGSSSLVISVYCLHSLHFSSPCKYSDFVLYWMKRQRTWQFH